MTDEGYRRRLYCIEWHVNLWRVHGAPLDACEAALVHLQECLDADYYRVERPVADDPDIARLERYLDALYVSPHPMICGTLPTDHFA